ncbi:Asp23/Gls24 family envelope stress response protein [Streptomyces sp. JJ66]|nr:Asp23/Gls24 family envelope stress response protein [Streptomyces sp. JJ66]
MPCGRALEEVWDAWETDPSRAADDPHTATCPYCATALADLRTLDGLVRQEAARDAERSAASEAPETTGVTERVMTIVRTELRPGAAVPLGGEDEDTWIVETAVARTCRTAAEKVPGVRAGSCRVVPLDAPDRRFPLPGARLPRGPVRVRLGVTAPLNLRLPVPELADAVRRQVREAAESQLGLDVRAVDVRVLDLLEDPTEDD